MTRATSHPTTLRGPDFFAMMAAQPPFSTLHPRIGEFYKSYLGAEKATRFGRQWVINTQFPPYPSRAFENMTAHFTSAPAKSRRLYSVTWAVTNRCPLSCRHCYNAGRSQQDLPLATMRRLAGQLQDRGAALVTITGGEPLLRDDLETIVRSFDNRSCLNVGTTGWGLTATRARALKSAGVFAMGISLDSDRAAEHDANRNRAGAFDAALAALRIAGRAGLYPYVVTVAWRHLLERRRFLRFVRFAASAGAREIHLLEPSATGRLAGRRDVLLNAGERQRILDYQGELAGRDDLPTLSTFGYLESPRAFGCGAGLTHIYLDGTGELSPCNLVPLSFGNVTREGLDAILARMGSCFRQPRCCCVGKTLARHIPQGALPLAPRESRELCRRHLPVRHTLPDFFRIRETAQSQAGRTELRDAYDRVGESYDDFWSVQAARPVRDLARRLKLTGQERVFEAGCGSGIGTALLAKRLVRGGSLLAADLSEGMLRQARKRLARCGIRISRWNGPAARTATAPRRKRSDDAGAISIHRGDALTALEKLRDLDLIFTTWVLGYIPCGKFFRRAADALAPGGRLALVVHQDRSPRREMDIFTRLVARRPAVLTQQVSFDFPKGPAHLREQLRAAGLTPTQIWSGRVTFRYRTAREVLDHLLKSGAGTVFHDAIDRRYRDELMGEFTTELGQKRSYEVVHDYVACIARK